MNDVFTYTPAEYQRRRNFNFVETYIRDMAFGLHKRRDIPIQEAESFIRKGIETGKIHYHDPMVRALKREENTDKHKYSTTLSQYLREVQSHKHIMSPTFTSYLHPMIRQSELSLFTEHNVKVRGQKKKSSFKKKAAGDLIGAAMDWNGQANAKENNNSTSGAFNSAHNPIYNRSAHSTLTSVCRTCASMANTNTERFTVGRRHLFSAEMTINNIINVLNNMDYDVCQSVIEKYQLHYVSHEELINALMESTSLYWRGDEPWNKLISFCRMLSPLERTIYLYTGDFYHVRVFNEDFVREMFREFVECPSIPDHPNKDEILKNVDEDVYVLCSLMFGRKTKEERPGYIANAVEHVNETINKYADFYRCFWRNDCLPPETARMPTMVRTAVLGGDTDSTLFTVMWWVEWYLGELNDSDEAVNVGATIIFFTSMMVKHYLAVVSGVMGIQQRRIHQMAMKNEFYFPVFMLTRRTKHYTALILAQEGNYNKEIEEEKKGVGLLNRKAPTFILEEADEFIRSIMMDAWTKRAIFLQPYMDKIAKLEYGIYDSIVHGSSDYLKKESIKEKSVYDKPMQSAYASYDLWENVFADKYGHIQSLPMQGVRVTLTIKTVRQVKLWLDSIQDKDVQAKMIDWMQRNDKKGFSSLILPLDIIAMRGIPIELRNVIDFRKIIFGIMETFYIVLESLGIYMINDNNTNLCVDQYPELFSSRVEYDTFMTGAIEDE